MRWLYFRWAVSRLEGKQGVHVRSTFASSPVPIICVFISLSPFLQIRMVEESLWQCLEEKERIL
jgi:hypothetical protein